MNEYTEVKNYLAHFGIAGQKWRLRRFQSYQVAPTRSGQTGQEVGEAAKQRARLRQYQKGEKMDATGSNLSATTKRVMRDYNNMSDEEFFGKYKATRNAYRKRVNKKGDPYLTNPYAQSRLSAKDKALRDEYWGGEKKTLMSRYVDHVGKKRNESFNKKTKSLDRDIKSLQDGRDELVRQGLFTEKEVDDMITSLSKQRDKNKANQKRYNTDGLSDYEERKAARDAKKNAGKSSIGETIKKGIDKSHEYARGNRQKIANAASKVGSGISNAADAAGKAAKRGAEKAMPYNKAARDTALNVGKNIAIASPLAAGVASTGYHAYKFANSDAGRKTGQQLSKAGKAVGRGASKVAGAVGRTAKRGVDKAMPYNNKARNTALNVAKELALSSPVTLAGAAKYPSDLYRAYKIDNSKLGKKATAWVNENIERPKQERRRKKKNQ